LRRNFEENSKPLGYHESDHVLNIAEGALTDGRCLEDLELKRNDEAWWTQATKTSGRLLISDKSRLFAIPAESSRLHKRCTQTGTENFSRFFPKNSHFARSLPAGLSASSLAELVLSNLFEPQAGAGG
jgi:hypothetical protein